ncbi:MAG: helix-turn-helix transcriptional regulator [Scrofimicrobium sp.]
MAWNEKTALALGEQIRARRRAASLSQEELAYRAGITKNQVQLIEAGRQSGRDTGRPSNPRMSTVAGLADGLGVRVSDLLNDLG